MTVPATVIDSDQHLYEPRTMWLDHIDAKHRDEALSLVDDELGYTWVTWRGRRLELADVHQPGNVDWPGQHRARRRQGEPAAYRYDDLLPDTYWHPSARIDWLGSQGLDAAVCFPNFGLLWERRLSSSLPALTANMAAWNRWCAAVANDGRKQIHPVAHLTMRDPEWLLVQLELLQSNDIGLAMIAPAPVDGRPLSHRDHDRLWSAFVEHGVTPVFHVADQPRVFDDCWYTSDDSLAAPFDSVFLWVPPALALTDLILNGVFDRHPELHVGIVELSSIWVPQFLLMLDGGSAFTERLNGQPLAPLRQKPSDYFLQHVRVSSFSYEDPTRLIRRSGDVFMCCSDFPHSEGTATPLADYTASGCAPEDNPGLFHDNVQFLLSS